MAVEDTEGNLFISDTGNHRVQKLDADANVLAVVGRNGGDGTAGNGLGEFASPLALAVAPDGTLYVSEVDNQRIQALRLGTVLLSGVVTTAKTGLAGVTVSALGLPVQAISDADGFYTLTVPQGWSGQVKPFLAGQTFTPALRTVSAVAADTSGLTFAGSTAVPGQHTFVRAFASTGVGPGQLNRPWHLALDQGGNVYVADQNNHRVQKFTPDGAFVTSWGRNGGDGAVGSGDGEFNTPTGIAVDHAGSVYVADHSNHRVQRFSAAGAFLGTWGRNGGDGSAGGGGGEFTQPMGLAVDTAGCIYVGEAGNGRIQKFDRYGNLLHAWTTAAGHGVAVDGAGRVYVLNYLANTVWQYTWSNAAETYQNTATWLVAGSPGGFCVEDSGTLCVAETWASRVRRFTPDGTEVTQWGSGGTGAGQFSIPCGVVVGSDGWVYVSDTGNNRIQQFRRTNGPPRTVTFAAANGGHIEGATRQVLEEGGTTTAVSAIPGPGYQFWRWTVAGALFSTEDTLILVNVMADMLVTAEFQSTMPPSPPDVRAGSSLVEGVTIHAVSSEFTGSGWDLRAVHLVDGSGLSGEPPGHAQIAFPGGNSWQTMTGSGTGTVAFDLQSPYGLQRLRVWNLNFYPPYHGRGARQVTILTSLDGNDWTHQGTETFTIATGADGDPGFDLDASAWGEARYVRFDILNNFGLHDNAGHVGISEVRFIKDQDPGLPTWTWSSGGGGGNGTFRIKLDDPNLAQGATVTTATSWHPDTPLSQGTHTLYVQERDDSGRWSESGSFSIDVLCTHTVTFATDGTAGATLAGDNPQAVNHAADATEVLAAAPVGAHFARWSRDGVEYSTDNPLIVAGVTTDMALVAEFAVNTYTVVFQPGVNGRLAGDLAQTVAHGDSTAAVTAVPDYGFVFGHWSDGSGEISRTVANVTADLLLTAVFVPATVVGPPTGTLLAVVDPAAAAAGRGWWDLSGDYATVVANSPLALTLVEDTKGKISGPAVLQVTTGKAIVPVAIAIQGNVKGCAGTLLVTLHLRGADNANGITVSLSLKVTLDAVARQLRGMVTGTIRTPAGSTPVAETVVLDIPLSTDGSWTLALHLVQSGTAVTGSSELTLSNGVSHALLVKGTAAGTTVSLSLAGAPRDPAAKRLVIRASMTALSGGWAWLDALRGRGHGQTIAW